MAQEAQGGGPSVPPQMEPQPSGQPAADSQPRTQRAAPRGLVGLLGRIGGRVGESRDRAMQGLRSGVAQYEEARRIAQGDPEAIKRGQERLNQQYALESRRRWDQGTTVEVPGSSREALSPVVQERVYQAQAELVRAQEARIRADGKDPAKLTPEEQAKYKRENVVVVLRNGEQILMINGDPQEYDITPDGQIRLKTYEEHVTDDKGKPVMEKDPATGQDVEKVITHTGEVRVASVSFDSRTGTAGRFPTSVDTARVWQADANGRAVLAPSDRLQPGGDPFATVADHLVTVKREKYPGSPSTADVYVVSVGSGSVDNLDPRVYYTIGDAVQHRDAQGNFTPPYGNGTSKVLEVAGVGAEGLQVADKSGGAVRIENIHDRWQVERPEPGQTTAQPAIEVVMSADDARLFSQMPKEHQAALFSNVDVNTVITVTPDDSEDIPATAVRLGPDARKQLERTARRDVTRTEEILGGRVSVDDLRKNSTASEVVVALLKGSTGFGTEDYQTAMSGANELVDGIRTAVDQEYRANPQGPTRQEIASRLLRERLQQRGLTNPDALLVEQFARNVGGLTDGERFKLVYSMQPKVEDGKTEDWRTYRERGVRELMQMRNMTQTDAESIFDRLHPESAQPLSEADALALYTNGVLSGAITTREQAREVLANPRITPETRAKIEALIDRDPKFRARPVLDLTTDEGVATLIGEMRNASAERLRVVMDELLRAQGLEAVRQQVAITPSSQNGSRG